MTTRFPFETDAELRDRVIDQPFRIALLEVLAKLGIPDARSRFTAISGMENLRKLLRHHAHRSSYPTGTIKK